MKVVNTGKLILGQGPLHVERLVLAEVAELCPRSADQLSLPVRVIVPSAALRQHLNRRLVQSSGRAVVGVVVQTLLGAAREILVNAGRRVETHEAAFEALVRRLARVHPAMQRGLEHLDDGFGAVVGSVRDLLDAGLETVHAEALFDKLDELERDEALSKDRLERARAAIEIAEAAARLCGQTGIQRISGIQLAASQALQKHGARLLPSRAVLVHGFADLTALAGDLLEAIVAVHPSRVFLDRPTDPDGSDRTEPGGVFLDRIRGVFSGLRTEELSAQDGDEAESVRVFETVDMDQQMRGVATGIRGLLDHGVPAEDIAVVARDLGQVIGHAMRHFDRIGVPYSVIGTTVDGAGWQRRAAALVDVLAEGPRTSVEAWLTLRLHRVDGTAELTTAFKVMGLKRLEDIADLTAERLGGRDVKLPVAHQIAIDGGRGFDDRRLVVGTVIEEKERAQAVLANLLSWPSKAPSTEYLARLQEILDLLGWTEEHPEVTTANAGIAALTDELRPLAAVESETWLHLLRRSLEREFLITPGGAGAGVQVLTVMEARAMTFAHLFLVGCERGLFPRPVVEDPLLPDTVRGRLCEVLPQMPVKNRGWAEDAFLFAQLLASSHDIRCSWSRRRNGSESSRSPFLERLLFRDGVEEEGPGVVYGAGNDTAAVSCFDLAVRAALSGVARADLVREYESAVVEGRWRAEVFSPRVPSLSVAAARIELLDVVDPASEELLRSPFWGQIGRDISGSRPSVSFLESVAVCPWRAFVTQVLGVRRVADPSLDFPEFETVIRGNVVHGVLDAIVSGALGEEVRSLARASTRTPVEVPWPVEDRLDAMVADVVEKELSRRRLVGAVSPALVLELVKPYLEVARAVEWVANGAVAGVLGAEVEGLLEHGGVELGFRVDRVDEAAGLLDFVDYKTGKPLHGNAKKPETRRGKLLTHVKEGRTLQVAAYVHAAGGRAATGRYVYLDPGTTYDADEVRLARATSEDGALEQAFSGAVKTILGALRHGSVFPRVEKVEGAKCDVACEWWCQVSEACIRGDTDQRRRLIGWLNAELCEGAEEPSTSEGAAKSIWRMGTGL